jgi:hypothetical protein
VTASEVTIKSIRWIIPSFYGGTNLRFDSKKLAEWYGKQSIG